MSRFNTDKSQLPDAKEWAYWDDKIKTACDLIKPFGSVEIDCVPK